MTPSRVPIVERIAALSDQDAVTVLALVAKRRHAPVDAVNADEQHARLREALAQPEIGETIPAEPDATEGDLARTALTHLVALDPSTTGVIDQAIDLAPRTLGDPTRDPTLGLATAALVLWVFHADIDLSHEPGKGWKFRFRTKGLSDTVIGKLLGQLLGAYTKPGP